MTHLKIAATESTPSVDLNPETGVFEVVGKSVPQDAESFFAPVLDWLEEYILAPRQKTSIILNLEYFNISSSKRILFILYKMNELIDQNKEVHVRWYYAETDEDMKEVGHDFAFMVRVPFEFVSYQKSKEAVQV
jgi:hypothetical protein